MKKNFSQKISNFEISTQLILPVMLVIVPLFIAGYFAFTIFLKNNLMDDMKKIHERQKRTIHEDIKRIGKKALSISSLLSGTRDIKKG